MTDLNRQLELLYDAIGRTVETDINKVAVARYSDGRGHAMVQDFRGGRTDRQIENDIELLIHNICSLQAHLRGWARKTCRGVTHVDEAFETSRDLKILFDLWNRKKHHGADRRGGYTGLHPELINFNAGLTLATSGAGSAAYFCKPGGAQNIALAGGGMGVVALNADIVDGDGNFVADFKHVAARGAGVWSNLLERLMR